ncbi:hypothetical protein CG740_32160 [Streptomyces sp. CB01201]|uniref:hypothetical protein n=1 Tax=Streptomyces sp. CB01201 TaxID=2020324 RepID=UPI000C2716E6|nr:hypothetical protein [Streptomyces sp. CB01201]PJM98994.1 hypothetical protein CG740_32160 [Streptomyces sp. CB01201]
MAAADHAVHRDVRAVARGEERWPTALFGPFCAASAAPSILAPTGGGHPAAPAPRESTFGELGAGPPSARACPARACRGTGSSTPAAHTLFAELGTGVSDDTALPALSVPPHRTPPSAQENR